MGDTIRLTVRSFGCSSIFMCGPRNWPAYRGMVKIFVIKFRRKTNLVFANVFEKSEGRKGVSESVKVPE